MDPTALRWISSISNLYNIVMTTGEAVGEVRLNRGFIEFHNWDRQEQLDWKTTTTTLAQKETPGTPSQKPAPSSQTL